MDAPTTVDHYISLLAPLAPREKLELIARLSADLVGSEVSAIDKALNPIQVDSTSGQRGWAPLLHKWQGEETTDELVELIYSHRSPPREPVDL